MKTRPTNCPNCGAVLKGGTCEYCGTMVYLYLSTNAEPTVNVDGVAESIRQMPPKPKYDKLFDALYGIRDCFGQIWYRRDVDGRLMTAKEILDMEEENDES